MRGNAGETRNGDCTPWPSAQRWWFFRKSVSTAILEQLWARELLLFPFMHPPTQCILYISQGE